MNSPLPLRLTWVAMRDSEPGEAGTYRVAYRDGTFDDRAWTKDRRWAPHPRNEAPTHWLKYDFGRQGPDSAG